MISEHKTSFGPWPVVDWKPGQELPNAGEVLPRIAIDYDDKKGWPATFTQFLETPFAAQVPGLVVGSWIGSDWEQSVVPVVGALIAAQKQLPQLKALFIGDITFEQNEISWIGQTDISPLFEAFPHLEWLGVRGSEGLSIGTPQHEKLQGLVLEAGGLPRAVVRAASEAKLPNLKHLELWLGTSDYGGDSEVSDVQTLLEGKNFPNLHYLGLRNSESVDEIAGALSGAPILQQIRVLDLSLGTLTDVGAQALLDNPALAGLEKLDVHHHFCSEEMTAKLQALPCEVDVSEREEGDEYDGTVYRYVAHGE